MTMETADVAKATATITAEPAVSVTATAEPTGTMAVAIVTAETAAMVTASAAAGATIRYRFADGHYENIEVTPEFKREYEEMERQEKRLERKETRRCVSLDRLLENDYKNGNGEFDCGSQHEYLLADDSSNPLEKAILAEETAQLQKHPMLMLTSLTDYQRRVAIARYIEHKNLTEIAKVEKVTTSSIYKLLKKISKKAAEFLSF